MYKIIFLFLFAGVVHAAESNIPQCVGKLCFGSKELPTVKDLGKVLGVDGAGLENKENICFKTKSGNHLLVKFFEHGMPKDNIELVIVAKDSLCKGKKIEGKNIPDLKLDSKFQIGSKYSELIKTYGEPKHYLTGDKLKRFGIDPIEKNISTDAVALYTPNDENSLLAAFLFFKNKKLVAFHVGVSE